MSRANWNIIAIAIALALGVFAGPWFMGQMRSLPSAQHLVARSGQRIVALEVVGLTSAADTPRVASSCNCTRRASAALG